MILKELCNRDVVVVGADSLVLEAAKLMKRYNVGDVIVVKREQGNVTPVGILTDRDIVVELIADEVDVKTVSVGDVMSIELHTANENEDSSDVLKRMKRKGIRRLPIVNDDNQLQGIISVDDILELISEEQIDIASILSQQREESAIV